MTTIKLQKKYSREQVPWNVTPMTSIRGTLQTGDVSTAKYTTADRRNGTREATHDNQNGIAKHWFVADDAGNPLIFNRGSVQNIKTEVISHYGAHQDTCYYQTLFAENPNLIRN